MTAPLAIVGMACRYADARTPTELWENALAQRQAFRRIPPERLPLADYFSPDRQAADLMYATEAALITDYTFDRTHFRVAGETYRVTDPVHWLALAVAAQALADAGFADGVGLPTATTGVIVGNTLTGEVARAHLLRLRWPYVRRVVASHLHAVGWSTGQVDHWLAAVEESYKAPFPANNEESLAGGLANTIAGRICNYFDFHGGGYTVDGACASSLLAVIQACTALTTGDLDVALVGGVDVSLDPFELVGFARAGALTPDQMRVFDARANGFLPGEGCGFVLLMRADEAAQRGCPIYATLAGWGVSSDGNGGMTRPEVAGQQLALARAYRRAGFTIASVPYFEGHGTGTAVGDTVELQALTQARREQEACAPAVISSVKANLGHTKAAAGMAGLIKAVMALATRVLPPATNCRTPHPLLDEAGATLRVLAQATPWPAAAPLRAGVSAMGFGGINTHLVLARDLALPPHMLPQQRQLMHTAQDAELFFLAAADSAGLQAQVAQLTARAAQLSYAELTDLAAHLATTLVDGPVRAALVAATPAELAVRLQALQERLQQGPTTTIDVAAGLFLGIGATNPRLLFLFSGQGSPVYHGSGAWGRRFPTLHTLYPQDRDQDTPVALAVDTSVAQPAIVTASLAALQVLTQWNVTAAAAIGHSLGELTALHWAGAFDGATVQQLATVRGQIMGAVTHEQGGMAGIGATYAEVCHLLKSDVAIDIDKASVIACRNGPRQQVVAGASAAIDAVIKAAQSCGWAATRLPVSHAFHSPLMAPAVDPLAAYLVTLPCTPLQRPLYSTVTGGLLLAETDLCALLSEQVTAPVRFAEALSAAAKQADLLIEVGPGATLTQLSAALTKVPAVAVDAGGTSLRGLLTATGAAFALGAPVNCTALFVDRFTRPFDLQQQPCFFVNPCEANSCEEMRRSDSLHTAIALPPPVALPQSRLTTPALPGLDAAYTAPVPAGAPPDALTLLRHQVARRTELPLAAIHATDRFLSELHLNSITVSQLMIEVAQQLGVSAPLAPTDYANARLCDVAQALANLGRAPTKAAVARTTLPGIDSWVRAFTMTLTASPLPATTVGRTGAGVQGPQPGWQLLAPPHHPLAAALAAALPSTVAGNGVLVCLSPDPFACPSQLLFGGVRALQQLPPDAPRHFVIVQPSGSGGALARTLHLEQPEVITGVITVPARQPAAATWVLNELNARPPHGHWEAVYDSDGQRSTPTFRLLPLPTTAAPLPLGPTDVLLVTGGGKGITAECAFDLAVASGATLALLGRAQPENDAELAANLARMAAAGIPLRYVVADVTNAQAVRVAIEEIEAAFGPVTGLLHGAAYNHPQLLSALDEAAAQRTFGPKIDGFRHLLAALNPAQLRVLVTFGSLIARTGLPGAGDYGLANEWLTHLTEQFQQRFPACRCLAVEWSVWSGVGMGAKLGRLENLLRQGITPITTEVGVAYLRRLLALAPTERPVAVAVSGRFGAGDPTTALPTLAMPQPDLPFLRFLAEPRVYYPGIELIVDADVAAITDPYLTDHCLAGECLLPAVMGLEAMVQVAGALAQSTATPTLEAVSFNRPVVVAPQTAQTLRLAALVQEDGAIAVALRCAATAFQVDHFRAVCRFDATPAPAVTIQLPNDGVVALDPGEDLYGRLLFQQGRFQRLRAYQWLTATACRATVAVQPPDGWFSHYLPGQLLLGDPGVRDAALHAIQVCVPQHTLLPVGVARLSPGPALHAPTAVCVVQAQERWHEGDAYLYDVEITTTEGALCERWEGLRLQRINQRNHLPSWPVALVGPLLERRLTATWPQQWLKVVFTADGTGATPRRVRSSQAMQRAIGQPLPIHHRPDGKPWVAAPYALSAAHAGAFTLAVAGRTTVACDLEPVTVRSPALWQDLLGALHAPVAAQVATTAQEEYQQAATRVWCAKECLRKAGLMVDAPLQLVDGDAEGWVFLAAGNSQIMTSVISINGGAAPLVAAILLSPCHLVTLSSSAEGTHACLRISSHRHF